MKSENEITSEEVRIFSKQTVLLSAVSKINNNNSTEIMSPSYFYRYRSHKYTKSKVDFAVCNYNVDSKINGVIKQYYHLHHYLPHKYTKPMRDYHNAVFLKIRYNKLAN